MLQQGPARRLFAFITITLTVILFAACGASNPQKASSSKAAAQNSDAIVVAMVGDSITYSGGNSNSAGVVPQLQAMLGSKFEVLNFGVNGATALKVSNKPYWTQPEYQQALASSPDAVVIMLGTNDSKTENWKGGNNEFQTDYLELIDSLQSLPSKPKVWLGLNLPAYSDAWTINGEVIENEIHPLVKDVAYMASVTLVDYHALFENREDLMGDGIHPNYQGNKVMAQKLSEILRTHFKK